MSALSAALLQLYRIARATAAPEFKDAALEAIKQYLPFDFAMWGTFVRTPEQARVHTVHLYRLPARKMEEYEKVKQYDALYPQLIARPGRTFSASLSKLSGQMHPKMVAYVRRNHIEHVLATIWIDNALNLCTAVSLYRGAAGPAFAESDRRLKQQLVPHLFEAWNVNAIQYVDRGPGGAHSPCRARALIDREGVLYNAEPGFAGLMRSEFPDWMGPQIPQALREMLISAGGESYRGDAIIASRLREIDDGMFLVSVRPLAGVERLSPRELTVAREFAIGRTHKEIAQAKGVAPTTVRNQLQSVYAKLGVDSKIALAKRLDERD